LKDGALEDVPAGRQWSRCGQEKSEKRSLPDIKRVALKYCGGCNPGFDRVAYVERIKSAAGLNIEWVTLDEGDVDAVLLVSGCDTACPRRSIDFSKYKKTVTIRDDKVSPDYLVKILLESEATNED
jgi:hypothetical protein